MKTVVLILELLLLCGLMTFALWAYLLWNVTRLARPFRFFSNRWQQFTWWRPGHFTWKGKRLPLLPEGCVVLIWLKQLADARQAASAAGARPPRLAQYVREFRWIIWRDQRRPLLWCLKHEDTPLRLLSIYLLGRMDIRGIGRAIAGLKSDPDPAIRREVARALRRKAAFAELAIMHRDQNPRVRGIARTLLARRHAYMLRLARYVRHVPRERRLPFEQPVTMPVFSREPIGSGKLPKTRSLIRRILEHIRHLVRGNGDRHAA